nr:serine/threonine-protein kinase [Kofleriaceae bacterium]
MGAAPSVAPTRYGKYALVAKLAMGGMAEIFLARLEGAAGFAKLVCIKRMLPSLARDPQLVQMFMSEAKIAAQISHHNVCQVFELGELDGRYYIAMEYLEGVPLGCFRRPDLYPAPPDARLVAGLGAQACEGLHHAHNLKRPDGSSMEVVHRDVSANNLFATVDGVVKVLDFGIAKIQDASVRTSTGSVKGTYAYMAPEQLRGERVDRRTDVFAMGTVLWETFARRHLFKRETEYLTFQAITTDPIPDVCELRPDVPPELGAAIAKALSRDREQRWPTARALGEAISKSVGVLGGPATPSEIADEIARGFVGRLKEQRVLVQMAHEGRGFDLEMDVGPGVGHGTELVTTPVSMITGQSKRGDTRAQVTTVDPVVVAPAVAPAMPTASAMPVAPRGGGRRWLAVAGIGVVVGAGAGAVAIWGVGSGSGGADSGQVAAAEQAAASPATMPMPVPSPLPTKTTTTPVATTSPSPSPSMSTTTTTTTTPTTSTSAATASTVKAKPRPRSAEPKEAPKGPDGFITIDSAPVYASISIDGRSYGDTPLIHVELAPGRHAVHAVSPSGSTHNLAITIEPGKVAPAARIEW